MERRTTLFLSRVKSKKSKRTEFILVLLSLAIVLFTGCKAIDPTGAANFATCVTTVKSQANDALNAAASLTRAAGVTHVAKQATLKESDFAETPTADIISEWDRTLSSLETYALNISALASPTVAKNFDVAATNLFEQFTLTAARLSTNAFTSSPQISAGLAAGFTELASTILRARAQATARNVALATDPQIQKILGLLAAEIGENHTDPCLRTTIYQTWEAKKASLTGPFLRAKDDNEKEAIVLQYAALLAQRSAQDQSLIGLRRALLALGDAHHGLALGNQTSIEAALVIVVSELQRTRDLYSQFSADLKK
jgi:hypothetical protein